MRGASHAAEMALYHLTRAYETLADHSARKAYDQSAGLSEEPVLPKLPPPPKRRRFFALAENEPPAEEVSVDYYEVLRLDPEADTVIVPEAFAVMRNYYLRIAAQQEARWELLDILEEARSVIADPELRRLYDQERANRDCRASLRREQGQRPKKLIQRPNRSGLRNRRQRAAAKSKPSLRPPRNRPQLRPTARVPRAGARRPARMGRSRRRGLRPVQRQKPRRRRRRSSRTRRSRRNGGR